MTADLSRSRAMNAAARGYSAVVMQQGRMLTDSDWNEGFAIAAARAEAAHVAAFGRAGTMKSDPGFAVTAGAQGFRIGAGRYWIEGLALDNPAETGFDAQPGQAAFPAGIAEGAEVLVWLEARRDIASPFEDARLNDPALAGVDTAWRETARWRVGLSAVSLDAAARADLIAAARCGRLPPLPEFAPGSGRMRVTTAPATLTEDDDCLIPPEAGYLSQENQLYRIEIVQGGSRAQARFVWSRENGSVRAELSLANGAFALGGARTDEALGFTSGDWVELSDAGTRAQGRPGSFHRLTLTNGLPSFTPAIANFGQLVAPQIRRWDHGGTTAGGLALTPAPVPLERGLQLAFTEGTYRVGDFWVFEARAATGKPVWPPVAGGAEEVAPMGWGRRYAALALARRQGAGLAQITDLRALVPALSCLQAGDIGFDAGACSFEADTVQEALEALCRRPMGGGLCTAVVRSAGELQETVAALAPLQSIRICLAGTQFPLPETLVLRGLGHVVIEGTGPQTVLSVGRGEAALLFENCASVRVTDLSVNGGPGGAGTDTAGGLVKGRRGALTMLGCAAVSVERVIARCRAGLDRAAACIATRDCRTVTLRDCVARPGQAQIGLEVIGARRAEIESNLIRPVPAQNRRQVQDRIASDPALRARLSRGLVWFAERDRGAGLPLLARRPRVARDDSGGAPTEMTLFEMRGLRNGRKIAAGGESVTVSGFLGLPAALERALAGNRQNPVTKAVQLRALLRNLIDAALRGDGAATLARRQVRLLDKAELGLAGTAYCAQGIVVAGAAVEEALIRANRIEGANEGIRVAASTRGDPVPPSWAQQRPETLIRRAIVTQNCITLTPLSDFTPAFGLFFGHADRLLVEGNEIRGPGRTEKGRAPPHYGIWQYGWRGAQLLWSGNVAADLQTGFAVLPALEEPFGLWRLRDNVGTGVAIEYLCDPQVEVL